jgi:deoxyadenosine/deoxycytidine kinase
MSKPYFVAVAGNIGSGKTTLTTLLAQHYRWKPYFEEVVDNPYLADFYKDMNRYALPLQLRFLSHRARDIRRISQNRESSIQDRTLYEDAEIFAKNLFLSGRMDVRDYQTYREIAEFLFEELKSPTLILYLRTSIPTLRKRIQARGRPYEQTIETTYLSALNERYENWSSSYRYGKLITIEADEIDPEKSANDFQGICRLLESALEQPELFSESRR